MRIFQYLLLLALLISVSFFSSCEKESLLTDNSVKLKFSVDTLRFDTAFTQLGTAIRVLKVYNTYTQAISISKISINNPSGYRFDLNVDGIAGNAATDVRIPAKDSIYIFAKVTIDPNKPVSESPFVIDEKLNFVTNGNEQSVVLEAWGQNANYIPTPSDPANGKGKIAVLNCKGGEIVFNDPKPYVIFGILVVDNGTLTIPAGTRIHVHGGIAKNPDVGIFNDGRIYTSTSGKLNIKGTLEKPVIIQGDRLEKDYENESGQWTGIILSKGSTGNTFEHTIIKNSIIGVYADSATTLSLKNCQIYNTTGSGIRAVQSQVTAQNCLFYNNFNSALEVSFGGKYDFRYCTMANYGNKASALSLNNYICTKSNGLQCTEAAVYPLNATFINCILYGSNKDEIDLQDVAKRAGFFNYNFQNCIVKVEDLLKTDNQPNFFDNCKDCINAKLTDKIFKNIGKNIYTLDSLSIADKKAIPLSNIKLDLINKTRDEKTPDLGCYELIPK